MSNKYKGSGCEDDPMQCCQQLELLKIDPLIHRTSLLFSLGEVLEIVLGFWIKETIQREETKRERSWIQANLNVK